MAKKKKRKKKGKSQRAGYDGAQNTRLTSDWVASGATADFLIHSAGDRLRNRARDLDRNNDYVISAVNKFCIKVLGERNPIFQSRIKKNRSTGLNETLNNAIEAQFKKWMHDPASCSVNKMWNFNRVLDLCVRTLIVDGEIFIRKITKARGRSNVRLCLELIEADNLADTYTGTQGGNGNPIVNGVEYDEWGAPVAYWFYPYSPNDFIYGRHRNYNKNFAEPLRYPAEEIIHLYSPRRVTQGRGVSFLSATVNRLRDLVGYEQATLIGARMRAAIMGFIYSPEPEDTYGQADPTNANAPRQYSFEPGTIQKLNDGEQFQLSNPQDPGPNLEAFGRYQLRAFAANLGIAYSSLSGDYSQANYSSERANQVDERRGIRRIQDLIRDQLMNPIADTWLETAVLQGVIKIPPSLETPDYYCCYEWRLGGFEWVDPQKDARAYELQLKNGMTSLTRVLGEKNIDLHTLIEERQYEQELLERAGIKVAYIPAPPPVQDPPVEPTETEIQIQEGLTQVRSLIEVQGQQIQVLSEAIRTQQPPEIQPVTLDQAKPVPDDWNFAYGLTQIRAQSQRKKKNCNKKPCGNSCISPKKACLRDLSPEQRKLAEKARRAMKKGEIGEAVEIPTAVNIDTDLADSKTLEEWQTALSTVEAGIASYGDVDQKLAEAEEKFESLSKQREENQNKSVAALTGEGPPLTDEEKAEAQKVIDDYQAAFEEINALSADKYNKDELESQKAIIDGIIAYKKGQTQAVAPAAQISNEIESLNSEKTAVLQRRETVFAEIGSQIEAAEQNFSALNEAYFDKTFEISALERDLRKIKGREPEKRQARAEIRKQIKEKKEERQELYEKLSVANVDRLDAEKPLREIDIEIEILDAKINSKNRDLAFLSENPDADLNTLRMRTLDRTKRDPVIGRGDTSLDSSQEGFETYLSKKEALNRRYIDSHKDNFSDIVGSNFLRKDFMDPADDSSHKVKYLVFRGSNPINATMGVESFEFLEENWNGQVYDINFTVDGSYIDVGLSPKGSYRAGKTAATIWREEIEPKLPPGSLVMNSPIDGQGGKRDRAYQSMGFGRTTSDGRQAAIVGNDRKLIPIDLSPTEDYEFRRSGNATRTSPDYDSMDFGAIMDEVRGYSLSAVVPPEEDDT